MDWRKLIAGGDHPPNGLVPLAIVCTAFALFAYAWAIDFIAAHWLMWGAVVPAIFVGVVGGRWARWFIPRGNYALRGVVGTDGGCFTGLLLITMRALVALCAWFVLVRAVGGGITRLTGHAATLPPIRMSRWYDINARPSTCKDSLRGGAVSQFGQGCLCLSKSQLAEYRGIPEGDTWNPPHYSFGVQLVGTQGPFGFYITSFKRVSNPQSTEDVANKGGRFDYSNGMVN